MICDMEKLENFDYSKHLEALLKAIKGIWNIRVSSKEYSEFIKDYQDFKGQEDLDEKAILKLFDGCDNTGVGSFSFPISISIPHIAYNDICQGISPLHTIIGAVFGYGIAYGMRMEEIGKNSNTHYRLNSIAHCICMMDGNNNHEKKELYRRELNEYFNVKVDHMITSKKYNKLHDEVNKRNVIPMIRKMLKSTKSTIFTLVKSNFKLQKPVWDILFDLCVGRVLEENSVFIDLQKELKQFGIILKLRLKRGTHPMVFTFKRAK